MHDMKNWLAAGIALLSAVVVLMLVLVVRVGTLQQQVDDLNTNVGGLESTVSNGSSSVDTPEDVCRFLGAWAATNHVDLTKVFTDPTVSDCATTAMATYSAVKG